MLYFRGRGLETRAGKDWRKLFIIWARLKLFCFSLFRVGLAANLFKVHFSSVISTRRATITRFGLRTRDGFVPHGGNTYWQICYEVTEHLCGLALATFQQPGTSRVVARVKRRQTEWYNREREQSLKRTRCRNVLPLTWSGAYVRRCAEVQGDGLLCCVLFDFASLAWGWILRGLLHENRGARLSTRSARTDNCVFATSIAIVFPVLYVLGWFLYHARLLCCIFHSFCYVSA